MNDPTRTRRKIDPTRRPGHRPLALKPDGTPDDEDRVEIGPTDAAFAEWKALGLTPPDLPRLREARLARIVDQLQARDYAGVLLFDPLNIRYATDTTNMQVWIAHNPGRAALVCADGHLILWDFHRCGHLSAHLPLIDEVREADGFFYFVAGDQEEAIATRFAQEIDAIVRERGGGNRCLAVDRIELAGAFALQRLGFDLHSGGAVMEHARAAKSVDEVNAMRCALATCEIAMAAMRDAIQPGVSEVELWSILHAENIKRGGEWIETRILSSGPRTNPWMQEAGPRKLRDGDLVALDTDLIGPYGMCADLSRTWFCGDGRPSDEQRVLHAVAVEHVSANFELLKPGVSFRELTERGHRLPDRYRAQRYAVMMHGVGLCDEYPAIYYPEDFVEGAFDYVLEPGMTLCVEVYAGAEGGRDGVKLENQVLITDSGAASLTRCPYDDRLMD